MTHLTPPWLFAVHGYRKPKDQLWVFDYWQQLWWKLLLSMSLLYVWTMHVYYYNVYDLRLLQSLQSEERIRPVCDGWSTDPGVCCAVTLAGARGFLASGHDWHFYGRTCRFCIPHLHYLTLLLHVVLNQLCSEEPVPYPI